MSLLGSIHYLFYRLDRSFLFERRRNFPLFAVEVVMVSLLLMRWKISSLIVRMDYFDIFLSTGSVDQRYDVLEMPRRPPKMRITET